MNVAGLLAEVGLLGGTVKFQPVESKLIVDVPEGFPDALVQRLRVNKQEIIHHINKGRYEPAYLHPNQRDYELMELVRRVEEEGYVLLWSNVLGDLVAFHRDDVDPAAIPAGFVPYSDDELHCLFGDDGVKRSPDALRLIHAAKRSGVAMPGSAEDEGRAADDEHHRI